MLHCNRNFFLLCSSNFLLFNIVPSCLSLSPWDKRHNLFPLSSEYMAFFFLPSKLVQPLNDFCCCSWNSLQFVNIHQQIRSAISSLPYNKKITSLWTKEWRLCTYRPKSHHAFLSFSSISAHMYIICCLLKPQGLL